MATSSASLLTIQLNMNRVSRDLRALEVGSGAPHALVEMAESIEALAAHIEALAVHVARLVEAHGT